MKIFVAFGFNDRDKWIVDMVFPMIRAFGDEVDTGEELEGDQITPTIIKKIRQSDALIGFCTRRGDPYEVEKWRTHRWVTDELSQAISNHLSVVEVREEGVDDQRGIMGDRQPIVYKEKERDKCLVELVKTIGKWHEALSINLKILPEETNNELAPIFRKPGFKCTYSLLINGREGEEIPTRILPIKGGLFVKAREVPREALIQVHIEYQGTQWFSSFESIETPSIKLSKE